MVERDMGLSLDENAESGKSGSEIAATESIIPKEIDEALDSIPDPAQAKAVRSIMSLQFGAISATPESTISKKIKPEHITQYLDDSRTAMEEAYKERHEDKIFKVVILVCVMIFLIALVVLLRDKPDILEKIIYAAGGLIAGAVGGFGYGYKKGHDE